MSLRDRCSAALRTRLGGIEHIHVLNRGHHFGLACESYAHTTSPIRRYADLLCQQAAHALHSTPGAMTPQPSETLVRWINACEQRAVKAERATAKQLACIALARADGVRGIGWIAAVTDFGVFIELESTPNVQGLCHVSAINGEYWERIGSTTLVSSNAQELRIGDQVLATLSSGDLDRGHINAKIDRVVSRMRVKR